MSCGEIIENKYELNNISTRTIWGDDGHYYLINIPNVYGEEYLNITFDATNSPNFNGFIVIYSSKNIQETNSYKKI